MSLSPTDPALQLWRPTHWEEPALWNIANSTGLKSFSSQTTCKQQKLFLSIWGLQASIVRFIFLNPLNIFLTHVFCTFSFQSDIFSSMNIKHQWWWSFHSAAWDTAVVNNTTVWILWKVWCKYLVFAPTWNQISVVHNRRQCNICYASEKIWHRK